MRIRLNSFVDDGKVTKFDWSTYPKVSGWMANIAASKAGKKLEPNRQRQTKSSSLQRIDRGVDFASFGNFL